MNAVYRYVYGSDEEHDGEPAGGGSNGTEAQSEGTSRDREELNRGVGQGYYATYQLISNGHLLKSIELYI